MNSVKAQVWSRTFSQVVRQVDGYISGACRQLIRSQTRAHYPFQIWQRGAWPARQSVTRQIMDQANETTLYKS